MEQDEQLDAKFAELKVPFSQILHDVDPKRLL
jgi:hypothetical protein